MSTADENAERIGRAMVTGTYAITPAELGVLLVAASAAPLDLADPQGGLEQLVGRLWSDLRAIDETVAEQSRRIAADLGHPRTTVALAALFTNTQPPTERTRP